jgi:hypothetical protein
MRPRLQPLGTDFGNGAVDWAFFQRDDDQGRYLRAKHTPVLRGARTPRERYRIVTGPVEDEAHRAVLAFVDDTLAAERPDLPRSQAVYGDAFADRYAAVSDAVQEDFVVQLRDERAEEGDRAIAVYVCFPSGWRPEAIPGWSFRRIHAPVPDFADDDAPARSLVTAMVERGPYVRFVWTLCADAELDHHPDEGPRTTFGPDSRQGWLRVERQVTVPFPAESASLFLIRTYLYAFSALGVAQRGVLAQALRCMPEATSRYKGMEPGREHALRVLGELDLLEERQELEVREELAAREGQQGTTGG